MQRCLENKMINILCSYSNFDESWGYSAIEPYLSASDEVCVLPLEHQDGWLSEEVSLRNVYQKGADAYETLVRPLRAFGIKDQQIHWVDDSDTIVSTKEKIKNSNVLILLGSHPVDMIERIEDLQIKDELRNYDGVMIGISAGAMIQLDLFHMTADYFEEFSFGEGLGVISGFDVDMHYQPESEHLYAMIRAIEDQDLAVVCCPEKSMMIIDGDHYELAGDAFVVSRENLDELYEAYEQSKVPYGW